MMNAIETEAKFTSGVYGKRDVVVVRGVGATVWDEDGRSLIDCVAGIAVANVGHSHPTVVQAITQQAQTIITVPEMVYNDKRAQLSARLVEILPGDLNRVFLCNSGTEAVESAIHLALCHTKRRYIISFTSCFHGEGLGTKMVSAYNSNNNLYMEAWSGGVLKAPFPYSENIPAGMSHAQYSEYCLWYLETHLPEFVVPAENIAAILIEPGLAEGGNWIPSRDFFQGVRRICDKYDWLMIADEVLTGLGRTARMWGVEHYDVVPDILVAGKNMSGGVEPCAGVAARDDILGDNPRATAGSTFAGTPAGCAACLKTLEIYERDNILAHAAKLADIAAERMALWESRYDIVTQVRNLGLLMGVSFAGESKPGEEFFVARAVRHEMLRRGVWAICDNQAQVRMYPALNMPPETLLQGLDIMEEAIDSVQRKGANVGDYPPMPSGNVGF